MHLALDAAVFENAGPFPLLFVRGSDDSCVKTNEFEPFIDEIAEETWFRKEYVITIPGGDRELRVEKSAAVSASTDAARRVAMARRYNRRRRRGHAPLRKARWRIYVFILSPIGI